MKRVLSILCATIGAWLGITWLALHVGGVASIETEGPDGSLRTTKVWYAEPGGELWLEAGAPTNGWFVDIQREPAITLRAETRSGDYRAEVLPGESPRLKLRRELRAKYGWRDWWVSWLVDSTAATAVRLKPRSSVN